MNNINIFLKKYNNKLSKFEINFNIKQKKIIDKFNILYNKIITLYNYKNIIIYLNIRNGIYLYGNIGTGKSYITNMFYQNINILKKHKLKLHFYKFTNFIHNKIRLLNKTNNLFNKIYIFFKKKYFLIYLDELFIDDMCNSVILHKLFNKIINKIIIVITSNIKPIFLYKNKLQKNQLINFIKLLNKKLNILNINYNFDYRTLKNKFIYFNNKLIKNKINKKSIILPIKYKNINILNETIKTIYISTYNILINLKNLCEQNYNYKIFIKIIFLYNYFYLYDINTDFTKIDILKRFTIFIDEIYEKKKKIIILNFNKFIKKNKFFFLKRTNSRLIEINSLKYNV